MGVRNVRMEMLVGIRMGSFIGKKGMWVPAVEKADGSKRWYCNDNLHRMDGPAIEMRSGIKCWYIAGEEVKKEEHPWWISDQEKKRLSEALASSSKAGATNSLSIHLKWLCVLWFCF